MTARRAPMSGRGTRWVRGAALLWLAFFFSVSATAAELSRDERLAMLPTEGIPLYAPAEIRWSAQQVPFITVQDARDLPFLLGLIHGHLRRTQMDMLRRVVYGRTAEMAGVVAADVDALLRTVDLTRAVPAMAAQLDAATRAWVEAFVDGINWHGERINRWPADARWLGLDAHEPWTVEDVLAIGRLGSIDISIGRKLGLLRLREEAHFAEYRARLQEYEARGEPSFGPGEPTPLGALATLGRSGSNSFVVGARRSASGAPIIANDPHLGYLLPNLWMLVGYRSPDGAAIGFSFPATPAIVVGRNDHAGFGGTNMAAFSHALYALPETAELHEAEEETIRVRGWPNRRYQRAESAWGPVVRDGGALKRMGLPGPTAIRWQGHAASTEMRSWLAASRATSWEAYRDAFVGYAVAGQNLLYAGADGDIGQLLALIHRPAAAHNGAQLIEPATTEALERWSVGPRDSRALPAVHNPPQALLVSANNVPILTTPPISAGGNQNDRVRRIRALIRAKPRLSVADVQAIQRDTWHGSAHAAAQALLSRVHGRALGERSHELVTALAQWDGHFDIDSRGAALWFHVSSRFVDRHYAPRWGEPIAKHLRNSLALQTFLNEDLREGAIDFALIEEVLAASARAAGRDRWGDVHRLEVQHVLGRVPLLGRRWRYGDIPLPGNNATVAKSVGPWNGEKHTAYFGQQARHVSDMADRDANHFILFGGNDGWPESVNFRDQLPLFLAGEMLSLPLSTEGVARVFERRMALQPIADRSAADNKPSPAPRVVPEVPAAP
ncbi:MAG: penicillin acylase family protein [Oceanococcaceae bacterium]